MESASPLRAIAAVADELGSAELMGGSEPTSSTDEDADLQKILEEDDDSDSLLLGEGAFTSPEKRRQELEVLLLVVVSCQRLDLAVRRLLLVLSGHVFLF